MRRRSTHFKRDPGDTTDVDVVLPAFDLATWRALRRLIADPASLGATHRLWRLRQEASRAQALAKGYRVHDLRIDPAAAVAWCRRRKLALEYGSIARYLLVLFAEQRSPAAGRA